MWTIHHPVLGHNRLLAPQPFGATQKPSDCEQHSWLQQFFLPRHWQHCLAMVTKVNIQNVKFLSFCHPCPAPLQLGVHTCRRKGFKMAGRSQATAGLLLFKAPAWETATCCLEWDYINSVRTREGAGWLNAACAQCADRGVLGKHQLKKQNLPL